MGATNLEERRCRCYVLITKEAHNLEEHQGSCVEWYTKREARGQHKVAVKLTCSAGKTGCLERKWRLCGQEENTREKKEKG